MRLPAAADRRVGLGSEGLRNPAVIGGRDVDAGGQVVVPRSPERMLTSRLVSIAVGGWPCVLAMDHGSRRSGGPRARVAGARPNRRRFL